MRKLSFIVTEKHDGKSVQAVLINNGTSKRLITKLKQIENGITKNGVHARTIDTVKTGDKIEILLEDTKTLEPNSTLNVPIIYEDDDLIVFDKPAFMPVHPSHKHLTDTLGNFFAYHCEGLTFRPINRLDRDTSGLCLVAKNRFCAVKLQSSLEKTYFAIACGKITQAGTIDAPIARVDNSIITRHVAGNGQQAITHYQVIKATKKFSFLKIKLETGRTHQIRVHFSYLGFPLAGDNMYGGDTLYLSRQALHCGEIDFIHPVTNKKMNLVSQLPFELSKLLEI